MTCLSQKGRGLHTYSTAAVPPCSGFAPDSLVQLTMCVGGFHPVAHSPQNKPGFIVTVRTGRLSLRLPQYRPWAISGIEARKRCPKCNPAAFLSGTVQGEHRPELSHFPFSFVPGLPNAVCFSASSPPSSGGTVPAVFPFPQGFGEALSPGIWAAVSVQLCEGLHSRCQTSVPAAASQRSP